METKTHLTSLTLDVQETGAGPNRDSDENTPGRWDRGCFVTT
jgi:hypothetical protein